MDKQERVEYHRSVRSPHEDQGSKGKKKVPAQAGVRPSGCAPTGGLGKRHSLQSAIQILLRTCAHKSCNWRARYRLSVWRTTHMPLPHRRTQASGPFFLFSPSSFLSAALPLVSASTDIASSHCPIRVMPRLHRLVGMRSVCRFALDARSGFWV